MTVLLEAFWAGVIAPYVEQARPRLVLLAAGGQPMPGKPDLIERLLAACGPAGGAVHVADPSPAFDIEAARQQGGDRFVLHRAHGRDVAGLLPTPDLVLLDTDPNWYTVHGILHALRAQARRLDRPFPPTLLGNTAWPYARRDGYADPAAIPDEARRPYKAAGLRPGHAAPCPSGGLFAGGFHAVTENEPENGVLTAVEEFVLSQSPDLAVATLPLLHGLGVLYTRAAAEAPALRALLQSVSMGPAARSVAETAERGRLELAAENADLRRAQAAAAYRNDALHEALRQEQLAASALRRRGPPAPAAARPGVLPDEPGEPPRAPGRLRRAARLVKWTVSRRLGAKLAEERQQQASAALSAADVARLRASPILDPEWYLERYGDVAESGQDPAEHYARHGAAEQRDPGPLFSAEYYRAHNPDVAEAGINPLLHYLASGAGEGRNPHPLFDTRSYLERYDDVAQAGINPLEHYLASGRAEGRRPSP